MGLAGPVRRLIRRGKGDLVLWWSDVGCATDDTMAAHAAAAGQFGRPTGNGVRSPSPPRWLHGERHLSSRGGWLRAAVLGADDGIVSTASLIIGVAASNASRSATLTAGVAGLVAGAMSMATGEYVSVASQRDVEQADMNRERVELAADPEAELAELAGVYEQRGLDTQLARQVAAELTAGGRVFETHLRDELGLSAHHLARPVQASLTSALSFALGALIPLLAFLAAPSAWRVPIVAGTSLGGLIALGTVGAAAGGAPRARAGWRVLIGGAIAMAITASIGRLAGAVGL